MTQDQLTELQDATGWTFLPCIFHPPPPEGLAFGRLVDWEQTIVNCRALAEQPNKTAGPTTQHHEVVGVLSRTPFDDEHTRYDHYTASMGQGAPPHPPADKPWDWHNYEQKILDNMHRPAGHPPPKPPTSKDHVAVNEEILRSERIAATPDARRLILWGGGRAPPDERHNTPDRTPHDVGRPGRACWTTEAGPLPPP